MYFVLHFARSTKTDFDFLCFLDIFKVKSVVPLSIIYLPDHSKFVVRHKPWRLYDVDVFFSVGKARSQIRTIVGAPHVHSLNMF